MNPKKIAAAVKKHLKPLFSRKMIPYVLLGELLYWSPLIVIAILALFSPELWAVFGAVYGVWVFLLPAIPIQVVIILGLYKIHKIVRRKNDDSYNP